MLAEYLEKEASQVKTAADQFKEIISVIDKVAAVTTDTEPNPAAEYLSPSNVETALFSEVRESPGGVAKMLLKSKKLPRTAEATNNPSVELEADDPKDVPAEGGSTYLHALESTPAPSVDPLKNDTARSTVLKTTAGGERVGRKIRAKMSEKEKKGSFAATAEKLASEGRIRTLEGWNKEASVKPPKVVGSQLQKAFKNARNIGKPKPPKNPQMGPITGFLKKVQR